MPLIRLESAADSRLDVYRNLKASNLTRWSGRFVVEGRRLVERLLQSDFSVESVVLIEKLVEEFRPLLPPGCPALVLSGPEVRRLIGYDFHLGALACARRKPNAKLEQVVPAGAERLTFIVCPDVNDPENLGTILRVGAAFGVDAVMLGRGCADPFSRRVLRVSMGAVLRLPVIESDDLRADVRLLAERWHVQLTAAVLDEDAEPLEAAARPPRLGLVFGNEAQGLRREWVQMCDRRVTIPMELGTDSLNVGVAAAVCLYHFSRVAGRRAAWEEAAECASP